MGVELPNLLSNHMEADTKICYLLHHALRMNDREKTVVMRSSSEDIDIPIILLAIGLDNLYAFIDNGTGKCRRLFHLNACELSGLAYTHFQGMTTSHRFCGKERLHFGRW